MKSASARKNGLEFFSKTEHRLADGILLAPVLVIRPCSPGVTKANTQAKS